RPKLMQRTCPKLAEADCDTVTRVRLVTGIGRYLLGGEAHGEDRALARLARHNHISPHHPGEFARKGKAQARSTVAPRSQGMGLGEPREELRLLCRRHADAGVGDRKLDPVASIHKFAHLEGDFPLVSELARIA